MVSFTIAVNQKMSIAEIGFWGLGKMLRRLTKKKKSEINREKPTLEQDKFDAFIYCSHEMVDGSGTFYWHGTTCHQFLNSREAQATLISLSLLMITI